MLRSPEFVIEDRDDIASLVHQHPWAVVASAVDGVPVISHAPGTYVPTWNSVVVHPHGVAESLDGEPR